MKLCRRADSGTGRFYDVRKFTPEQVRQDDSLLWRKARIFQGGEWRKVRYKEVSVIYWQSGAGQRPLRLFVVAPIPYRAPGRKRKYYRDPAFLLTTDLRGTPREMLQAYFDRWQIEVNHREEKDTLGIGQAQLRSPLSVPRQPAFAVPTYSALLLAALLTFGTGRDSHYQSLPKWRRNADRPSCLDLITLLCKEMADHPALLVSLRPRNHLEIAGSCCRCLKTNVQTPYAGQKAGIAALKGRATLRWRAKPIFGSKTRITPIVKPGCRSCAEDNLASL